MFQSSCKLKYTLFNNSYTDIFKIIKFKKYQNPVIADFTILKNLLLQNIYHK